MSFSRKLLMAAGVVAMTALGFAVSASAASIAYVSGTIYWGAGSPVSAVSSPNEVAHFGFNVSDQLPISDHSAVAQNLTDFTYYLDNISVTSPAVQQVIFYDLSLKGLFDIDFAGGPVVSLYGPDIGNFGSTWLIGSPGMYMGNVALNNGSSTGVGAVTLAVSAVPLPAALPLFGAALAGLGVFGWKFKRDSVV